MSPLTKTFVVILVIFSLLLTAATVVYVGKQDTRLDMLTATEQELARARTLAESARSGEQAAQATAQALQAQFDALNQQHTTALNEAQQRVADLNVQLAQLQATSARQELQLSNLSEAAEAAQQMANRFQETLENLRGRNDTLLAQTTDMNAAISDLTNRLEVTERERRFLAEQLQEAQQQVASYTALLRDNNIPLEAAQTAGARAGAPEIQGVIRETRTIGGLPYATISVGATDQVRPGMQFRIVEGDQFLGTLTVNAVEPEEATGQLSGPRIGEVRPGTRVQTQ